MKRPSPALLTLLVAIASWLLLRATVGIDVRSLPHGRGTVHFTDRYGEPLGSIAASNVRESAWVPLARVAPAFVSAIVAAEDARFYRHGAVDVGALARATRDYVVDGEVRSGGSTIAMQLARSACNVPGGIVGKLVQIVDAERIVIASPPNAILEAYVNRVPMGGDIYGVAAAARDYFGVSAADLDLAQASLLAAIPNDPSRLSPYAGWEALRARQRYVLERMQSDGAITQAQRVAAARERVEVLAPAQGPQDAQHFLFALDAQLPPGRGIVRTTIDLPLQRYVQAQVEAVVGALSQEHVADAAALVIDNRTGDVLAYVGSPDYFSDALLGRNDGVLALRQPGSSLKPFTYELALERGAIEPTTILRDAPAAYAIPGGKLYEPQDYSTRFAGPVRVRYALANSLNVPAVQVLSRVGVGSLLDRLHALGFSHLRHPASFYGLGLTLGSGEVTLAELADAYMTMARRGSELPLREVLDSPQPAARQIGNPTTWIVVDMLADPYARAQSFGVDSILRLPFPAAVKTGTSSDYRDTWTVGFTRDYTVGVWAGNFDGSAMRGVSGVTGAAPLWNRIMLHLYENRPDPPHFALPAGYARVPICATTGLPPQPGCLATVREWVQRVRETAWRRRARPIASLRILFPSNGDVFALETPGGATVTQRIELRADTATPVEWSLGGQRLRSDADGNAFWPLHLGRWIVRAKNRTGAAQVSIDVVPAPRIRHHAGFSEITQARPQRAEKQAHAIVPPQ